MTPEKLDQDINKNDYIKIMLQHNNEVMKEYAQKVGKAQARIEHTIKWLENPKERIFSKKQIIRLLKNTLNSIQ